MANPSRGSAPASHMPPCPYCEKAGLPILLTRYGIAPEKAFMARPGKPPVTSAVPKAESSVGDPKPAIASDKKGEPNQPIPLGKVSEAHYTVRSLRGGYAYVYYEVSKSWEAYGVDNEGRLAKVSLDSYMPPQVDPFHPSCKTNMQKVANASLLTIQDPATAGKIWFGFSDAWWTSAVRKENESEGVRKLHMRCIDVQGWYNENTPAKPPKCAAPIANVDAVVADYAMSGDDARHMFWWSPFPVAQQDPFQVPRRRTLKDECRRLLPDKGLIVVLDDPVAILQEISAYIDKRWRYFVSQNDDKDPLNPGETWHRKLTLSSSLDTLRLHVEREAETSVYAAAKEARHNIETLDAGDGRRVANTALLLPSYRKMVKPILDETVTQAELEKVRMERWGPHAKLLDWSQRQAFEKRFAHASEMHDATYTTPMAIAHAAWLRSANLHAVFDHHFDMHDINSGIAFPGVALACVAGTGALGACTQVYEDWFNQPLDKSPLWRAMLLNHQPLIAAVDTASSDSSAPFTNVDDWTNVFGTYTAASSKLKEFGAKIGASARAPGVRMDLIESVDVLPALLQEFGPHTSEWLSARGKKATALLATLGMRSGQKIRWVQVVGTRRELYNTMLEVSLKAQEGRGISSSQLQGSVSEQLRTFEIEGIPMEEKVHFWSVVFDEEAQRNLGKPGVLPKKPGEAVLKTVKMITVEELKESTLAKVIGFATHSGTLAAVGLVLAALGYRSAGSADSAMKHLQGRAATKISALYSAGIGSLLDLVRSGAKAVVARKNPMLSPWLAARLGKNGFAIWEGVGGIAGGAGMIALGVIDAKNAMEAHSRDQKGMVVLYTINAGSELYVGGYSTLAGLNLIFRLGLVFAEFNPIILGLTVIILATSVIIELEKDPLTMDWVRQCLWGEENNYQGEAEEIDNFSKALNG